MPAGKFERAETRRPLRVAASQGIYNDWIAACRGGRPRVLANFDNGGPLSELPMLGNITTPFPGEGIRYDPATGRILDPVPSWGTSTGGAGGFEAEGAARAS